MKVEIMTLPPVINLTPSHYLGKTAVKTLLGMNNEDNYVKDIYTLALNALAINHKVDYIRVHNVALHKKLLNLLENFEK